MNSKSKNLLTVFLTVMLFLSVVFYGLTMSSYTAHAADFTVTMMAYNGKDQEMYQFYIGVSGYTPTSNKYDYYMPELDSSVNVPDNIIINGKSVSEWNAEYRQKDELNQVVGIVADENWSFNMFPTNSVGYYDSLPIVIKGSKGAGAIVLYIHENLYNALVDEYGNMIVQAKSGLVAEGNTLSSDSGIFKVINNAGVPSSIEVMPDIIDVTENITVSNWIYQDNELNVFYINLGKGVMPNIGYDIIDKAEYQYIAQYIAINGKTIAEINSTTDTTDYTFSVFPSTAGDMYRVPIMVLVDDAYNIQVKIHDTYFATLEGDLTVTVLEGFNIVNEAKEYVVSENVNYIRKHGSWSDNWQTVDITENVSVSGWIHQDNELRVLNVDLGSGVLPNIGYGIIDNADYKYIAEYIAINGKTIKEINEETDVSEYEFHVFPSSADDKYKLPIMVLVDDAYNIQVKIHDTYYATLEGDLTVSVLEGLMVVNGSNEYVVSEDVTYARKHGSWGADWTTVDVTKNITVSGWTEINGIKALSIYLGDGVIPEGIDYNVHYGEYQYIADYITINGKTVKEINETIDAKDWTFGMFPSTADDKYRLPIIVYVKDDKIELRIHENYYAEIDGYLEISVLAELMIVNGETEYVVSEDVTYARKHGSWGADWTIVDVTKNITVSGWTEINGIKALSIYLGDGVIPEGIDYNVHYGEYQYIADYITINGKTVTEINETVDTTDWTFGMFPSTADDKYRLPIIVYVKDDKIELRIHENYYAEIDGYLEISVLAELMIVNGETEYVVSEDVTYARKHGSWGADWTTVDVTKNITVSGWTEINGLKVFNITFGEDVLPLINYGIHDAEYSYIAEYIMINGKTVKEINETIDAKDWTFEMFPSTADDKYKLPIIIHVNTERIEVRVHDWYYAILSGKIDVSVLEGLVIVNGSTEFIVGETSEFTRKSGKWLDLDYEYSINYYVNSDLYAVEKYKLNDTIEMLAAPETEVGYEFSGWDKQLIKINEGDEDVNGYITAIIYTITYNVDGGVNASVNPLKYTIESDEIVLQAAEKKGYVFDGWYDNDGNKVEEIKAGSYGNIVLNAKYVSVSGGGCFSGVSGSFFWCLVLLGCAVAVLNIKRAKRNAKK